MHRYFLIIVSLLFVWFCANGEGGRAQTSTNISTENVGQLEIQSTFALPADASPTYIEWLSEAGNLAAIHNGFAEPGVFVISMDESDAQPLFLSGRGEFSTDGQYWATQELTERGAVTTIYETTDGEIVRELYAEGEFVEASVVGFSIDNNILVSALAGPSFFGQVNFWDLETGDLLDNRQVPEHPTSIDFSADGNYVALAWQGGRVIVWDVDEQGPAIQERDDHANVATARFGGDGDFVISSGVDRVISLWLTEAGFFVLFQQGHSDLIYAMLSSNGSRLVVSDAAVRQGQSYTVLNIYDVDTAIDIQSDRVYGTEVPAEQERDILVAEHALPDDGTDFLVPGSVGFNASENILGYWNSGSQILLIDLNSGEQLRTIETGSDIHGAVFSPTTNLLVSWHENGEIDFWNPQDGELLHEINASPIKDIAFSADGTRLIILHEDRTLNVWRLSVD